MENPHGPSGGELSHSPHGKFSVDGWLVDPSLGRIERGHEGGRGGQRRVVRSLEPQAMKLLVRLAAADGELVTKEELLADVWENRAVVEHVLPKTVSQLRQAFGETASRPRIILTQPRRGYRLGCPVESHLVESPTFESSIEIRPRPRGLWPSIETTLAAAGLVITLAASPLMVPTLTTAPSPRSRIVKAPIRIETKFETKIETKVRIETDVGQAGGSQDEPGGPAQR